MGKMASPTLWAALLEALLSLQAQLCVVLSIILAESWVGNRGLRGGLWVSLCLPQRIRRTGKALGKPGLPGL